MKMKSSQWDPFNWRKFTASMTQQKSNQRVGGALQQSFDRYEEFLSIRSKNVIIWIHFLTQKFVVSIMKRTNLQQISTHVRKRVLQRSNCLLLFVIVKCYRVNMGIMSKSEFSKCKMKKYHWHNCCLAVQQWLASLPQG